MAKEKVKVPNNYIEMNRVFTGDDPWGVYNIVRKLIEKNGNSSYKVVVIPEHGKIYIAPSSTRRTDIKELHRFRLKEKMTAKECKFTADEIKQSIKVYNHNTLITFTRACSEFGRKKMYDLCYSDALIVERDNPYYKHMPAMRLYDINMLNYLLRG